MLSNEEDMGRAYRRHGVKWNACNILVGKSAKKRPREMPRNKWETVMKKILKNWIMGWIHLAQDRDQWKAHVSPKDVNQILSRRTAGGFWRKELVC
jgi:hypothetical protein